MNKVLATTLILALLALGALFLYSPASRTVTERFAAPSLEALSAEEAAAASDRLATALLTKIYSAFGETEEAAIYDALAAVTTGDALETLYFERVGVLADGGLEQDQTLHGMEIISSSASGMGKELELDAKWLVVGTVGHAEHHHVRGNIYSAEMQLEAVNGFWRISEFNVNDVDRTMAGLPFQQTDVTSTNADKDN